MTMTREERDARTAQRAAEGRARADERRAVKAGEEPPKKKAVKKAAKKQG
jgi:hypothetical protein